MKPKQLACKRTIRIVESDPNDTAQNVQFVLEIIHSWEPMLASALQHENPDQTLQLMLKSFYRQVSRVIYTDQI